jgi:BirA family transcriptional regulator, biotin operon repressor / biotin---[acetyl-CoA-carboxylase] ligase
MISQNSQLDIDKLGLSLTTKVFGREVQQFGNVTSTNEIARDLAERGGKEGTLIVARSQEQGRGRHHRHWFSPEGG